MLGKKLKCCTIKKLARKVKDINKKLEHCEPSQYHSLLKDDVRLKDQSSSSSSSSSFNSNRGTPAGFFAVYVGEERQRFVVPTAYLSHPLFKMLLDKASDEFGFKQMNGLVVPCSVTAFQEVVSAVECSNGNFDFGNLVEEFI